MKLFFCVCKCEPGTESVCLTTPTQSKYTLFWEGICLQVLHQAGPPPLDDCLVAMGNKRKVSFQTTQRRIISLGIEPGVSNFSITNPDSINRAIAPYCYR